MIRVFVLLVIFVVGAIVSFAAGRSWRDGEERDFGMLLPWLMFAAMLAVLTVGVLVLAGVIG